MIDPATLPLPELESYHRFLVMRRLHPSRFGQVPLERSAVLAFNRHLEAEIARLGAIIIRKGGVVSN